MKEVFEEAGAEVRIVPTVLNAPYVLGGLFAEHDVVVANTVLTWRTVLAAKCAGSKAIWFIHESRFGLEQLREIPQAVRAMALSDSVVFPARETLALYREFDCGNHLAINYGFQRPFVKGEAFKKEPGKLYVLTVGSIEPRKGQDLVLECAMRLPKKVLEDTEFLLQGRIMDERYAHHLRTVARTIGHVSFLPEMPPEDALQHIAAADILLCSSRDETGPLVVMEAMGLGRAVVSTRVGAVPDIMEDGLDGLIVEKEDFAGMADALTRLHGDPLFREKLGNRAKEKFDHCLTLERYGDDVEKELIRVTRRVYRT